jgi:hypothetical protein
VITCATPVLYCPHMATKNTTLASLAKLITTTAASADKKFVALAGDVADVKAEMMHQFDHIDEQFRANDARLRDISAEVASVHRSIARLEEQAQIAPASPRRSTTRWHASRPSRSTSASTKRSLPDRYHSPTSVETPAPAEPETGPPSEAIIGSLQGAR